MEFCKLDGKWAERFDITKRMHQEGFSIADIARATKVSKNEVKETLGCERSFRMVTQYE
jgi:lambda repressor-like predicted transcriptional regulator